MVASLTPLPVIGVPVPLKHLDGMDSLLSIVQMPAGVPVATVSIGGARNAGLLAVRILARHRPDVAGTDASGSSSSLLRPRTARTGRCPSRSVRSAGDPPADRDPADVASPVAVGSLGCRSGRWLRSGRRRWAALVRAGAAGRRYRLLRWCCTGAGPVRTSAQFVTGTPEPGGAAGPAGHRALPAGQHARPRPSCWPTASAAPRPTWPARPGRWPAPASSFWLIRQGDSVPPAA